jgi:septal ring factor EnvC (AmiA/AmiB activator)
MKWDIAEILTFIASVLGTSAIWKFAETKLKLRAEQKKEDVKNNDGVQYRDDLKRRVCKMEDLLKESAKEKDELRKQILNLTEEVASLRTKVEYLEKENDRLKSR